jgi:hypothetical protein
MDTFNTLLFHESNTQTNDVMSVIYLTLMFLFPFWIIVNSLTLENKNGVIEAKNNIMAHKNNELEERVKKLEAILSPLYSELYILHLSRFKKDKMTKLYYNTPRNPETIREKARAEHECKVAEELFTKFILARHTG